MKITFAPRFAKFLILLAILALLLAACDSSTFVLVTPETPTPRPAQAASAVEPAAAVASAPHATSSDERLARHEAVPQTCP